MKQNDFFKAEDYDLDLSTCSTTDCTGLIPALPESQSELEAYQDLYQYLPRAANRQESKE